MQDQFRPTEPENQPGRILFTGLLLAGLLGLVAGTVAAKPDIRPFQLAEEAAMVQAGGKVLTTGSVMDGFGVWSPSGKEIVFMRDGRLWAVATEGGKTTQLTRGEKRWDAVPTWRPGTTGEFAFIRLPVGGGDSKILLLDRQKGSERELVSEPSSIGYLAWTPDGKTLYYTTPQTLYKLDVASGKRAPVLSLKEGWEMTAGGVAVSPDSKQLVFGAGPRMERGVRYDLYALPLTGKNVPPERLTTEGGIMPAFAPGQPLRIAYRNPLNRTGIYVMTLPEHQITQIVPDDSRGMFFHPSWSPDGSELVISRLALDASPPPEGTGFISHLYRFPVKRDLPTASAKTMTGG